LLKAEEPAEEEIDELGEPVGLGAVRLQQEAQSAGLSVSELKAEMTVETAMVRANCL
jgi:hypothetical protein